MPIYEYQCRECGGRFDKLVRSMSKMPEAVLCPACGSDQTRRLVSAAAVHTGGNQAAAAAEAAASLPEPSPVFGRKELQAAAEAKARIKDEVASGN